MNVSRSGQEFNWGQAAVVAGVGAASGALIATGVGAVAGIQLFAGVGMASAGGGYLIANSVTESDFKTTDFVVNSAYGGVNGALGPVLGTTTAGAMALGAATNTLAYGVTGYLNGEDPSVDGLLTAAGSGALGGFVGGAYPRIDNTVFVDYPSRYLLQQGMGGLARGVLGGIVTSYKPKSNTSQSERPDGDLSLFTRRVAPSGRPQYAEMR